jgi:hypothetical protein
MPSMRTAASPSSADPPPTGWKLRGTQGSRFRHPPPHRRHHRRPPTPPSSPSRCPNHEAPPHHRPRRSPPLSSRRPRAGTARHRPRRPPQGRHQLTANKRNTPISAARSTGTSTSSTTRRSPRQANSATCSAKRSAAPHPQNPRTRDRGAQNRFQLLGRHPQPIFQSIRHPPPPGGKPASARKSTNSTNAPPRCRR